MKWPELVRHGARQTPCAAEGLEPCVLSQIYVGIPAPFSYLDPFLDDAGCAAGGAISVLRDAPRAMTRTGA
jgi:hypothetical protein